MLTRIRIEVDDATYRRLQEQAVAERRPMVDQAAVILARWARRARPANVERVPESEASSPEAASR